MAGIMRNKLMKAFGKKIQQDDASSQPAPTAHASAWTATDHFEYLLDTLKIEAQTTRGPLILHPKSLTEAREIIHDMTTNTNAIFAQAKDPTGTPIAIDVSVCAVQIEENGDNLRVRALPDAAHLKLINLTTPSCDVYYGHLDENQPMRDTVKSDPLAAINGSRNYIAQHDPLENFIQTIEGKNNSNTRSLGIGHRLNAQNFEELLTTTELRVFQNINAYELD